MPTVQQLLDQFPQEKSHKAVMDWLYEVFMRWQDDQCQGEVLLHRFGIAERIGGYYKLLPDFSMEPLRVINPGDSQAIERILRWGLATLADPNTQTLSIKIHFFLSCVKRWRNEMNA